MWFHYHEFMNSPSRLGQHSPLLRSAPRKCAVLAAKPLKLWPKLSMRFALGGALTVLLAGASHAGTPTIKANHITIDAHLSEPSTAELLYLVLLGELQVQAGEPGAGYSLILESAKKSGDGQLYRRAVNVALQAHSGDAALDAAKAWADAQPDVAESQKTLLQITLAMGRIADSAQPLTRLLELTPDVEREALFRVIAQTYAQVNDQTTGVQVAVGTLTPWTLKADTASAAWSAMGHVQLAAGLKGAALASNEKALQSNPVSESAGLLAVELMEIGETGAAKTLGAYLKVAPKDLLVRMAYTRHLVATEQLAEATAQLTVLTTHHAEAPEPWLLQGVLQIQDGNQALAQTNLEKYLALTDGSKAERAQRGRAQAFLLLSQVAEGQGDDTKAKAWLDRVEGSENLLRVQTRRASILARQGKVQEALELIRSTPEEQESDAREKTLAEVQLLKGLSRYGEAFDLLKSAVAQSPDDADLIYDQAMIAEKLERHEEMETLLRRVIALKPTRQDAYNALGYSMADRSVRLPEARQLILKAVELAPNDPFITDSLGWVEFRMGNLQESAKLLRSALASRGDAEILAHLAEVLWALGEHDEAVALFKRAQKMSGDNAVVKDAIQRLGVPL